MKDLKKYLALIIILTGFSIQSQESVLIRLKPQVGSTLTSELNMNIDMKMMVQGQEVLTKMKMGFVMLYKTIDRQNDVNKIEMTYDKITMDMKNPEMSGSFNSEIKEQTDPFAKQIATTFVGVLDNPIPLKVNTRGAMAEPLDISKLFTAIPAAKAKELEGQMKNQFIQFPEDEIGLGESWTILSPMAQMGDIKFTYTLIKINADNLEFSIKGKKDSTVENPAVTIKETSISGNMVLDRKTGELLFSNINMDMVITVDSQGQSMDMDMKTIMEIKASK